ncbi:jerky protein [Danaus plexippus plexippus]|uniref:Jerky protein n=1 Tax=Danaus plexippus plexippus TaxID=278856 RepID=A0A212EQQ1_DANPL|nr:jerky protein [Danaus plexippus plexippus]
MVKNFQKDVGKESDVLLLLDNAPTHPSAETLKRENGKFTLKFLPPNEMNLKDCCYMPVEAWNAVESLTLTRAWNKLLKLSPSANPATNPQEDCFEEITEAVKILSIGEGCDEENIKEWLDCDSEDPGFQILSDEEIVDDLNGCENEEKEETETEDECQGPSHAEAFEALEIAFKWFERQEESDSLQLLQLKRIRDLAVMKRCDSLRQRSLTSYFQPNL